MKKTILFALSFIGMTHAVIMAQEINANEVPVVVKQALATKYPHSTKVSWEKEKGNYEANWGGRSAEDTSVQFTPAGAFVQELQLIPLSDLPAAVPAYVSSHFNGAKIKEAGKGTDSSGKHFFEAEIKGQDLIFDENGKFVKKD